MRCEQENGEGSAVLLEMLERTLTPRVHCEKKGRAPMQTDVLETKKSAEAVEVRRVVVRRWGRRFEVRIFFSFFFSSFLLFLVLLRLVCSLACLLIRFQNDDGRSVCSWKRKTEKNRYMSDTRPTLCYSKIISSQPRLSLRKKKRQQQRQQMKRKRVDHSASHHQRTLHAHRL